MGFVPLSSGDYQFPADAVTAKGAAEDALAQEKAAHVLTRQALEKCEAATSRDCSTAIEAERERVVDALVSGFDLLATSIR